MHFVFAYTVKQQRRAQITYGKMGDRVRGEIPNTFEFPM